jgi:hypothetical protein
VNPQTDRTPPEQSVPAEPPPKKRFRIEKLEERIAPNCNPHSKAVGGGHPQSSATDSIGGCSLY